MHCTSCSAEIPDDSIFCTECGSRQDLSKASMPTQTGLSGAEVSGGRGFGVVSGEAIRQQREQGQQSGLPSELMSQISQQNLQQPVDQGLPSAADPIGGGLPASILDQMSAQPLPFDQPIANVPGIDPNLPIDPNFPLQDPNAASLPAMGFGDPGLTPESLQSTHNPSVSPTDEMVNRLSVAEKEVKNQRRSQWLQMNQESASSVLAQISGELPSHLQAEKSKAEEFLKDAIGKEDDKKGPDSNLLRRMAEVSVRRVARKRGVAVETPQSRSADDILTVNVTYVDDGRVLDTPQDLAQAFEHAISTELALKGLDMSAEVNLYRSKDGEVELVHGNADSGSAEEESDEEMFACEMCSGLVKESDNECPHCGAVFEDDEEESGPPGPGSRGGPRGPGGPSRGGPPGGGPSGGGPSRGGPPGSGPSRGGPPGGGPSRGGPPGGGPSRGGPPGGGPSRGGPPGGGPSRGGPPGGGPSRGGPPGGGPSRGGPPGGGPSKGGPPGGPSRGPPGGPSKGGPPKSGGPPKGPRKGPPR